MKPQPMRNSPTLASASPWTAAPRSPWTAQPAKPRKMAKTASSAATSRRGWRSENVENLFGIGLQAGAPACGDYAAGCGSGDRSSGATVRRVREAGGEEEADFRAA